MIQLPPMEFDFGNYGADLPFKAYMDGDMSIAKWMLTQDVVGYCDSRECEFRPTPEYICVMFQDDDWKSWSHVSKEVWKIYLDLLKRR